MSKPYTKLWSSLRVKWLGQQAVWLVKGYYGRAYDGEDRWVVFAAPSEAAAELYAETFRRDLSKARNNLIPYYLPLKKLNEGHWTPDSYTDPRWETAYNLWHKAVDEYEFLDKEMMRQVYLRRSLFPSSSYDGPIAYSVEMVMMMPDISDPFILERYLGEV